MHSALLLRSVALECVPSLHGSGAEAPTTRAPVPAPPEEEEPSDDEDE